MLSNTNEKEKKETKTKREEIVSICRNHHMWNVMVESINSVEEWQKITSMLLRFKNFNRGRLEVLECYTEALVRRWESANEQYKLNKVNRKLSWIMFAYAATPRSWHTSPTLWFAVTLLLRWI